MARIYHITNNIMTGEGVEERLRSIADVALLSVLLDLTGSNMIPLKCVTKELNQWAKEMVELAEVHVDPTKMPQVQINVRRMTEKIFENYQAPRVAMSPFVRVGPRAHLTIQDEELRLELERRGLEETILTPPPRSIQTQGRARIAAAVQKSMVDVEAQRQRQLEEQRRLDKEQEEIEETGFGRKVELD